MKHCAYCNKETSNPKFCSNSCAARSNNTSRNRKRKDRTCTRCHKTFTPQFKENMRRLCFSCRKVSLTAIIWSKPIGELMCSHDAHPSWFWAHVRRLTRARYKRENKTSACEICGYDKHVEVAHIKALTTFPKTATLEEACGPHNVKFLCPNHHWEFDNGLLALSCCAMGV